MDRLKLRRDLVHALGDGGTYAMADNVLDWLERQQDAKPGVRPADIVGVAEISQRLGRKKQSVCNWVARGYGFPTPVTELASGRVWDWEQVAVWAAGHQDLINMEGSR